MAHFFYFDQLNQKRGPYNEQQLRELAAQGAIGPNTPMETDAGHKGLAGQIPGLKFPAQTGGSDEQISAPGLTIVEQFRFRSDTEDTPILSLLSDFSFQELQPETIFLWFTKFAYGTGLILIILSTFACCGYVIYGAVAVQFSADHVPYPGVVSLVLLLALPFICLSGFLLLCWHRFCCEWSVITFHYSIRWLIGLAKLPYAVCMLLESKSKKER